MPFFCPFFEKKFFTVLSLTGKVFHFNVKVINVSCFQYCCYCAIESKDSKFYFSYEFRKSTDDIQVQCKIMGKTKRKAFKATPILGKENHFNV